MTVFPAGDVRILDTWNVSGMRGTGSHDITVDDVFVPAERSVWFSTDTPQRGGALYAFPVFGLLALGIAAVALGIARGASEDFLAIAGTKVATGGKKPIAERSATQATVARAHARLGEARAYVHETVREVWAAARAGATVTLEQRARLRLAATQAVRGAAETVDLMYEAGGATAIYADSPLQRRFRDVHVATQHILVAAADLRARRTRPARPAGGHGDAVKREPLPEFTTLQHRAHRRRAQDHDRAPDEQGERGRRRRCTRTSPRSSAALRRETDARCVLLTGDGRAFSAGGDFAWFPELQDPEHHGGRPPRRQADDLGPARRRGADRRRGERARGRARRVDRPAVRRDLRRRRRELRRPAREGRHRRRRRRRRDLAAGARSGARQAVPADRRRAHRDRGRAHRSHQLRRAGGGAGGASRSRSHSASPRARRSRCATPSSR